jgi:UDP-glucose 4-epimerase
MSHILVIGGAGYIGSHVNLLLGERNYPTVVLDNLSKGHREAVLCGEFVLGDMADDLLLSTLLKNFDIDVVMHFSAFSIVEESVSSPLKYYRNNIANTLKLLEVMIEHGVKKIVFSSTAAIYGEPTYVPIDEGHPKNPTNPYGKTKLAIENMLKDCDRAYGLRCVSLRYFNAAGADEKGRIGELHEPETHLIPRILSVAKLIKNRSSVGENAKVNIYGTDYNTPDGTCVRDYIHVNDLAEAHLMAVEHLKNGGESRTYNLGCGGGYSVRDVIEKVERIVGINLPVKESPRRPGDPARLLASLDKISREWNWQPARDLNEIIRTAWFWERKLENIIGQ